MKKKKNNKKYKVIQFIDLCGKQYNNQGWVYNDKGELVTKGSNYFKIIDKKDRYKKEVFQDFFKNAIESKSAFKIIDVKNGERFNDK